MKVFKYDQVTSTQDLARQYFPGNNKIAAFVANEQTRGYGKRSRDFYSPKNTGIYFSVAFPKFDLNQEKAGLLTLKIALEIVLKLQSVFPDKDFKLKWVNDIYLDGKKVAGILTEYTSDGLIVGVGINLQTSAFPNEISSKVGSITSGNYDKDGLIDELLLAVKKASKAYQDSVFLDEYRNYSNVIGKNVILQIGKNKIYGKVCEIDDYGRIVIEKDGQKVGHSSGEITKLLL